MALGFPAAPPPPQPPGSPMAAVLAAGTSRQGRAWDGLPATPSVSRQYDRGAAACHDGSVMRSGLWGVGGVSAFSRSVAEGAEPPGGCHAGLTHWRPPGSPGVTVQLPFGAGTKVGGGLPRHAASPAVTRNASSPRPC